MPINVSTSFIAMLAMLLVIRAFWPLARGEVSEFSGYMLRGVLVLMITLLLRTGYWDGVQWITGRHWFAIRAAFGGQMISVLFNLGFLGSAVLFLRARLELIPEEDREGWHWWNSWAHPGDKCVINWRTKR